ncbi:hypothetical protein ACN4EE_18020 [Geminocystis sp. CENA526]|uniref:hypothetical protein n=1 Tax=Geminocystis sp. CENA526 TaxID=1355871 RepID=UPI003D6FB26D
MLDTNTCIKYLNSSNNNIITPLNCLSPDNVFLCDIASIAIANNLILVTHNVCEFSRVENLKYEDWES